MRKRISLFTFRLESCTVVRCRANAVRTLFIAQRSRRRVPAKNLLSHFGDVFSRPNIDLWQRRVLNARGHISLHQIGDHKCNQIRRHFRRHIEIFANETWLWVPVTCKWDTQIWLSAFKFNTNLCFKRNYRCSNVSQRINHKVMSENGSNEQIILTT